ncbi:HD-GYP domain-containing protein [Kangiella sp. TOML190]|uniref:HD-GYP domain-containing protein n=1 Tax=Kangiella sp. TOML190 TaxID=2931351 RepID=UPI00203E4A99|nr:HD-GYP domain-containing protein [Kangiella sp. TOML190]
MSLIAKLFARQKTRKTPLQKQRQGVPVHQEVVKRKISSHELQIGMTVIDLDRPWTDLPFIFQEVTISTEKELDVFRRYCQHVYIDYTSLKLHREQQIANLRQQIRYKMEASSARKVQKSLKKELPKAKKAFDSSKHHIQEVMQQVQKDGHINVEQSKVLVSQCVSSILSNPSAMFWMTKIKDQDEYTAEHCLRVGILAITFGRHLQLSEEELHLLGLCGMLHDVGKMKIPNSILNKQSALTEQEFDIVKEHAVLGYIFLKEHGGIDEVVCTAAYNHHESLVGDGYPRQLDAAYLSVYDKIIAIVDSYDAMTSDRCYRKGMSPEKATAILYKEANHRYDKYLVKEFIKMVGVYPVGSLIKLNNGFYAIVLSVNPDSKLAPVVEIIADENKIPLKRRIAFDLSKQKKYKGQVLKIASSVSDTEIDLEVSNYIEKAVAI